MPRVRFRDPAGLTRDGEWTADGVVCGDRAYARSEIDVLPPTDPSKIVAVGYNYRDIVEEVDAPVPTQPRLFFKTPNTLVAHGATATLPSGVDRVAYEPEIGIVIGTQCKGVSEEDALDVIEGLTNVNDLAIDDDIPDDPGAVRASGFDNATPIGPAVVPYEDVPDDPNVELSINGETRHDTDFSDQLFPIPEIVANVTELITLEPGDVLTSGTPIHPEFLSPGDTVEIDIEGIPPLRHDVA